MHSLIQTILWIAPVFLTAISLGVGIAGVGIGSTTARIRADALFGIALIGAFTLMLHAGYFIAPFWWEEGKRYWALGLMLPLALTVLFLILVEPGLRKALVLKHHHRKGTPVAILCPILLVTLMLYWVPPALMLVTPDSRTMEHEILSAPIEPRPSDSPSDSRSGSGSASVGNPAMP